MPYTCPVCGYPKLNKDPNYCASFEICPSCWFHFRVDDDDKGITYAQWRQNWIASGMTWGGGKSASPPDWDPKKQLMNIGVELP